MESQTPQTTKQPLTFVRYTIGTEFSIEDGFSSEGDYAFLEEAQAALQQIQKTDPDAFLVMETLLLDRDNAAHQAIYRDGYKRLLGNDESDHADGKARPWDSYLDRD